MSTSPTPVVVQQSESNRMAPAHQPKTFADRFVNFWWVEIPLKLRRYSSLLGAAWSDGIYLTAWPRLATILVFALFLFGFAEGATHWSYRTIVGTNGFAGNVLAPMATADDWGGPSHLVFAGNLLLLIIGVAFGTLSANLGITLVIGYAFGDLFGPPLPFGPSWVQGDRFNTWIFRHVPLLTSYILFFMLTCLPILMAMELARSSHPLVPRSRRLMVGVTGLVEAALIYCWCAMAPMVFRTVQLWSGLNPRITVPFYHHLTSIWLVPTAIVAVLVRAFLVRPALQSRALQQRSPGLVPLRMPPWGQAVIGAGVITLLMTGFLHDPGTSERSLLTSFAEAELIFLGLAVALLARAYWLPSLPDWQIWTARVEQYPAVLRLAAATVVGYCLCLLLVAIPGVQSRQAGKFGPEVAALLSGLAMTLVLLPHGWAARHTSRRTLPWRRIPVPSPVGQAGIIAVLIMLTSKKAFADCYDFACCMAGAARAAAAAAAGGIPFLGGIAGAAGTGAAHGPSAGAGASGGSSWDKWDKKNRSNLSPPAPDGPPTMGPPKPGTSVPDDGPPVFGGFDPGSSFWHKLLQLDAHERQALQWYADHGGEGDSTDLPKSGSNNPTPPGGWLGGQL
jgi:hypothetical protein